MDNKEYSGEGSIATKGRAYPDQEDSLKKGTKRKETGREETGREEIRRGR